MGLVDAKRAIRHLGFCSPAELWEVKRYIEGRLDRAPEVVPFDVYVEKMRHTVPGVLVTRKDRSRLCAWCRMIVIYKMLCDGYAMDHIAQCFEMTVSSVKYAKRSIDKMLEVPKFYPDEYRIYCLYISNFAEYEENLGKD